MPSPGRAWMHITFSTLNAWLPGEERGFRSRRHKIHSSGDYRQRPPVEEHRGLREYWHRRAAAPATIPADCRAVIGRAMLKRLRAAGCRVLIISISGNHVHLLAELPRDPAELRRIVGLAKRAASLAVSERIPGRMWAKSCGIRHAKDRAYQLNVFRYIQRHREEGAWVWTFRDPWPEG